MTSGAGDARCQAAEQRERDDLKAQQGMARYAKELADLTTWQIGVALIAIFLLGVTLYYTRKATSAATDAAGAAGDVVKVTSDTAERQLRAYLSGIPSGINQLIDSNEGIGLVTIRNVGRLPARNVAVHVYMKIADERIDDFPVPEDDETVNRVIQPRAEMVQGSKGPLLHVRDLCTSGKYVYVWGVAYYDDGYGCRRFARFCHRYAAASHNREVVAILNREIVGKAAAPKTRHIIDADKARYHTEGNDAD